MPRATWTGVLALLVLGAACGPPTLVEGPSAVEQAQSQQSVQLHLRAVDAAGTELLAYAWTQEPALPAGAFSSTSARTPTWTAPTVPRPLTFTLRVTVVDRMGQRTRGEARVRVSPSRDTPRNTPPVFVQAPTSLPATARAGDTLTLSALAQDGEGDPLTYSWRQLSPEAPGTFPSAPLGARVTWYSPEVASATDFTFEVSVSDGHNPPVRQSVSVPVRVPRYAADIQPLFTALCTQCHGPAARLNLAEGLSHGGLVGVPAFTGRCKQRLPRVQPGAPESSALIYRLGGEDCGLRMPLNRPGYFDEHPDELVRLRSWILGGAHGD